MSEIQSVFRVLLLTLVPLKFRILLFQGPRAVLSTHAYQLVSGSPMVEPHDPIARP